MATANATGLIGFTNDAADTAPQFTQGVTAVSNGTTYTYAKATSAIAAAGTVALTGAYGATATGAGSTHTHDVAAPGVPAGSYFWAKKVTSAL